MTKTCCLFLFSLIIIVSSCCNVKKNTANSNEITVNKGDLNEGFFIVSFFSPGNGIDVEMKNNYLELINTNYPDLSFSSIRWGREGEIDFCFSLDELTKKQKQKFIQESRNFLSKSKKVNVYESKACREAKKTNR